MRIQTADVARDVAEKRFNRSRGATPFHKLDPEEQQRLVDEEILVLRDATPALLQTLTDEGTDFDAAAAALVGHEWDDLDDTGRKVARDTVRPILAAYLLAPMTTGPFDYELDYSPAYRAAVDKMKELLDRGMRDAEFLASIVLTDVIPHVEVTSWATSILKSTLQAYQEALENESRMREALASAEADRHPCTALHLRIDELRRRVGEQHGFTLIGCVRCGADMIATEPSTTHKNDDMECCARCTAAIFMDPKETASAKPAIPAV